MPPFTTPKRGYNRRLQSGLVYAGASDYLRSAYRALTRGPGEANIVS